MADARHVTKQHVVSQVVLTQFAIDGLLEAEDARQPGRWRAKAPGAVGYVRDYVRYDSGSAEALWGTVETRLHDAFVELGDGGVPQRGSGAEAALRDCVALHWARSDAVRAVAERAWQQVRQGGLASQAARPDVLAELHRRATGLPAGPDDLNAVNERLHQGPPEIASGEYFSTRVREFFEFARDRFDGLSIQVGRCADGAGDLLLSDRPVVTPSRTRSGLNPEQGVALGDADAVGMPIGPRLFVSLHPRPERVAIESERARDLNEWQRSVRQAQLFRRPLARH